MKTKDLDLIEVNKWALPLVSFKELKDSIIEMDSKLYIRQSQLDVLYFKDFSKCAKIRKMFVEFLTINNPPLSLSLLMSRI